MTDPLQLAIHPGAFPAAELARVRAALDRRTVLQSLHYQGAVQAARWRALYEKWSPFARLPGYRRVFEESFKAITDRTDGAVAIIGLGCGTGAKDALLLDHLPKSADRIDFVPIDVSVPLVCEAALAGGKRLSAQRVHPLIADLDTATNLDEWLADRLPDSSIRIFTFFSMLPNFSPGTILPKITGWLRPQDYLLLSVNLAPGPDLTGGLAKVLPQYDNPETRSWLFTVLEQGGIRPEDGSMRFAAELIGDGAEVGRIVARWRIHRACRLHVLADAYDFEPGDELELFFSCRYRTQTFPTALEEQGLKFEETWAADDGEEAIYLCRATGGR